MVLIFNPDYDQDIKCIWCGKEYVLIKKEAWFDAYTCHECNKNMGIPKITKSFKYETINGERMEKIHARASHYRFNIMVNKGMVMRFLTFLISNKFGYCHGVTCLGDPKGRSTWVLNVEASKGFDMEKVEWQLPPIIQVN